MIWMKVDSQILQLFSITIKNKIFDYSMPIFSNINNNGEIWILIALLLILQKNKRIKHTGIIMIVALFFGYILGEGIFKNIVQRQRPLEVDHYKFLISIPKSYSFPSGHTTSSFACLGVLWIRKIKGRWIALGLAILIAFSRVYLHVHYPTDVVGGIILGLLCAKLAIWIMEKRGEKNENHRKTI